MKNGGDSRDENAGRGEIDFDALEKELMKSVEEREDRALADKIRRDADRISSMILYSDLPKVDIEIAIRNFRREVLGLFPDKEELFDNLYFRRFRRLWSQFRRGEGEIE